MVLPGKPAGYIIGGTISHIKPHLLFHNEVSANNSTQEDLFQKALDNCIEPFSHQADPEKIKAAFDKPNII